MRAPTYVGPRHDLRIRPLAEPAATVLPDHHVLVQRLRDGRDIPLTTPLPFPEAAAEWRTRCGATSDPDRGTIGDWTAWHARGICAGDVAGCPHCGAIAEQGDQANGYDRMVLLANRRNLPLGIGNYTAHDDGLDRRTRMLRAKAVK
jgi:hypothetical protein